MQQREFQKGVRKQWRSTIRHLLRSPPARQAAKKYCPQGRPQTARAGMERRREAGCWGAALKPGGCLRNSINSANRIPKHPVCENGVLCLMCRKRAYANSAVGDKLHLARLLEWATPFTRATPLNELISVVFVNCGDEISQFVGKAAGAMKQ